jgi:hypothetical protein
MLKKKRLTDGFITSSEAAGEVMSREREESF